MKVSLFLISVVVAAPVWATTPVWAVHQTGGVMNCIQNGPDPAHADRIFIVPQPENPIVGPLPVPSTQPLRVRLILVSVDGNTLVSHEDMQLSRVSATTLHLAGDWYTPATHPSVAVDLHAGLQDVDFYGDHNPANVFHCDLYESTLGDRFWSKARYK